MARPRSPIDEDAIKEKRRATARTYYHAHREERLAYHKLYQQTHKKELNTYNRERYKSIRMARCGYLREWRRCNRKLFQSYVARTNARAVVNLLDWYIRACLRMTHKICNPTQEQIERRRGIIAAKRPFRSIKLHQAAKTLCNPSLSTP